jgi:transcriptional regulator with XRE-family HTH domain
MSDRRQRLAMELADSEYRQFYSEQHVNSVLAMQISAVREQRGLTQARLAERIGKHQTAVSRIENVNYARWNIKTLRQVAQALGLWLNVRLESWGKLVEDIETYSIEELRRERFEDDPYFWGSVATGRVAEPIRWIQQQLFPWLEKRADDQLLLEWLQGKGLPPVGDQDPPYVWVIRAIEVEGPESRHLALLKGWLAKLVPEAISSARVLESPDEFLVGLFSLAAVFRVPELFDEPLARIQQQIAADPNCLSETSKAALLSAIIRNQADGTLKSLWLDTIRTGEHPLLPANELDGFEGLKWLPPGPNVRALAEGLKALEIANWERPDAGIDVFACMRDIRETFQSFPELDQALWRYGSDLGWSSELVDSWVEIFAATFGGQLRLVKEADAAEPAILVNEFSTQLSIRNVPPEFPDPPQPTRSDAFDRAFAEFSELRRSAAASV